FGQRYRERLMTPGRDLLSQLARAEEGSEPMPIEEMLPYVALLLVAGNETTSNLLGNTMVALTDFPEQLEKAQAQPALFPQLVEGGLPHDRPARIISPRPLPGARGAGVRIPPHRQLMLLLSSANRDEARFPEPDRFDLGRDTRGHLAFGHGPHFCLGAPLA